MKTLKHQTSILALPVLALLVSCGGNLIIKTRGTPTPDSLKIVPTSAELSLDGSQKFKALGTYRDGTTIDLTHKVRWSLKGSDGSITKMDSTTLGLVLASSSGTDSVKASINKVVANASIDVKAISITKLMAYVSTPSLYPGVQTLLKVYGINNDGSITDMSSNSSLVCESSDAAVVSVSTSKACLLNLAKAGSAEILVTYKNTSASVPIVVQDVSSKSLSFQAMPAVLPKGITYQLFNYINYSNGAAFVGSNSDAASNVTCVSSAPSVISVTNPGCILKTVGSGSATITATNDNDPSMKVSQTLTSSGSLASLSPDQSSVALAPDVESTLSIKGVDSSGLAVPIANSDLIFSSSNTAVATVDSSGKIAGIKAGTAIITVKNSDAAVSAQIPVAVSSATLSSLSLSPSSLSLAPGAGQNYKLTAKYSDGTSYDVTTSSATKFSTSTGGIAVVDSSSNKGLVAGVSAGDAKITASFGGKSVDATGSVTSAALVSVALEKKHSADTLALGTAIKYVVKGTYADNTTRDITSIAEVYMSSTSGAGSVVVSNDATNGLLIYGSRTGSIAEITANVGGIKSTTSSISVAAKALKAIALSPAGTTSTSASSLQFSATGTYSDWSTASLTSSSTWASSSTSVATISSAGLLSMVSTGSTSVTAALSGVTSTSASVNATVTASGSGGSSSTLGDPSNLSSTVNSYSKITLSWTAGSNATSYQIAYASGATAPSSCSSGTTISQATVGNVVSYQVTGLSASTQYSFRVCSYASSTLSTGVTVTTTTTAPGNLRIFMSTTSGQGNTSYATWVTTCNTEGQAQFGGSTNWLPLLSTSTVAASASITVDGTFYNTRPVGSGGPQVLATSLSVLFGGGTRTALTKYYANGTTDGGGSIYTWTGATSTGGISANNCNNWTSNSSGVSGQIGDQYQNFSNWISDSPMGCQNSNYVQCVEQ